MKHAPRVTRFGGQKRVDHEALFPQAENEVAEEEKIEQHIDVEYAALYVEPTANCDLRPATCDLRAVASGNVLRVKFQI